MVEIFISHSVSDRKLADQIVDFIKEAVGVPARSIFCSSSPGRGVPFTKDFNDYMATAIREPKLVLAVLTESYLESHFCLMELGAAWALGHRTLPIVVPPLNFDVVSRTLGLVQGWKITDLDGLVNLRSAIVDAGVALEDRDDATWDRKRANWERDLNRNLLDLPTSTMVPKSQHLSVVEELADAHARNDELQRRLKLMRARELGKTVLIVDPEPLISLDIENILKNAGFEVVGITGNAHEALSLASQHRPHILISEAILANSVSGVEIAEKIAADVGCKVLFVTAYPERLDGRRAMGSVLVSKPYDPVQLVVAIEKSFNS